MLTSVHPFSVYAVKVHVLMRHEPKQYIKRINFEEEFYYETENCGSKAEAGA